jgi:hypothetical protein
MHAPPTSKSGLSGRHSRPLAQTIKQHPAPSRYYLCPEPFSTKIRPYRVFDDRTRNERHRWWSEDRRGRGRRSRSRTGNTGFVCTATIPLSRRRSQQGTAINVEPIRSCHCCGGSNDEGSASKKCGCGGGSGTETYGWGTARRRTAGRNVDGHAVGDGGECAAANAGGTMRMGSNAMRLE